MYPLRLLLLAVVCAVAGARPAVAQTMTARAGLDLTNVSFDDDTDVSGKVGVVGGVALQFNVLGPAVLQVEGLIAQKRVSFADGLIVDRLTFVDVPITVRYAVYGNGSGRTAHVFGGGIVSLLLAASEKAPGESFDIGDAVKKTNAGVVFGGDFALTTKWSVDARYVVGLTGTYNAFGDGSTGKLRTLQVTVGYRIR